MCAKFSHFMGRYKNYEMWMQKFEIEDTGDLQVFMEDETL